MAKATKQRKDDARAVADARRLTPGKMLRLLFKSLGFAVLVSLLILLLQAVGLPANNFWVTLPVMLVVYLAAYPVLMSEFRPKRDKR